MDKSRNRRENCSDCVLHSRKTVTHDVKHASYESRMSSSLIAHEVVEENDGVFVVTGVYTNTPKLELRGDRSEIHYGALLLRVQGNPAKSLEGHYWTDRNSCGSMRLSDRKTAIFSTYEEARKGYGEC